MPVMDFSRQDTTPGAGDLLSPPAGFNGQYFDFLKSQFESRTLGQAMRSLANYIEGNTGLRRKEAEVVGPYRAEALAGLRHIMATLKERAIAEGRPMPRAATGSGSVRPSPPSADELKGMPDMEDESPKGRVILGKQPRPPARS